jgi:hypothetical protein
MIWSKKASGPQFHIGIVRANKKGVNDSMSKDTQGRVASSEPPKTEWNHLARTGVYS